MARVFQVSRNVPADAGFLRYKEAIIGVVMQDILHVHTTAPIIRDHQNVIQQKDKGKRVCLFNM
jgi:hypothetical protein